MIIEEKKVKLSRFIGNKAFYRKLFAVMLPILIQNVITNFVSLLDNVMVGQVGTEPMSGVAIVNQLLFVFNLCIFGGLAGAGIFTAQFYGKDDHNGVRDTMRAKYYIALGSVVLFLLVFVLFGENLISAFLHEGNEGLDLGATLGHAKDYIAVMYFQMLPFAVTQVYSSTLRETGETMLPMKAGIAAVFVNLVFNYILIFGKFGAPEMGVEGAAIATDISQLVSCVLSLRFLIKSTDDCRVIPREIRLHKKMAARIIRVGLPTGIQNMVISFSNVLVQASVNSYGAAAMAGFAAYMKIDGFNILPVSSISMAATTFVGQNYGAGRLDRVKRSVWVTLAIGVIYTLCTGAALLAGQDAILHLFTADEAVVTYGKLAMRWFCPFYFLLSILHGLAGAVRGTGASVPPMVVLLVSLCLFRIVWIQWVLPLFSGIEGVFILYPVSWALGAGLMILYAWKGKWMEYHA